jgi:TolB-like protein/DNA-binding SARP family transcriptional activator
MNYCLHTFGGLRLVDADGADVSYPEKGLLILVYLLTTADGSTDRMTVSDLFWSAPDKSAALTNLRKTISRIKAAQTGMAHPLLAFTDGTVSLDRKRLSSDLSAFSIDDGDAIERLKTIVSLSAKTFLASVPAPTPRFDSWMSKLKQGHQAALKKTLSLVAGLVQSEDEFQAVKDAAILLFRDEPEDPDTLQSLIQIFNAEGEVEYLRHYFQARSESIARGIKVLNASASKVFAKIEVKTSSVAKAPDSTIKTLTTVGGRLAALPRLVLMPPANQASNPKAGLLASSLIEDITLGFCAFNSLQVIAPHSAVRIGHNVDDQTEFFERHGVTYVLDTRIASVHDETTLFVQLVFSSNREVVWAERFTLERFDLVRDRRAISRRIALTVSSEIERHESTRSYLELHPEAYHKYLTGRQYLNRWTLPNLRRARKEMKAALRESPTFAPALSAIAHTYSKEWLLTARGDMDLLHAAEAFAARSVEARTDLPDGYREFGVAKIFQGAFDESAEALMTAETLGPHYADVLADHADILVHCSRPQSALEKIDRAIELNPISPDYYLWTAASANFALQEFAASLDYIGQMTDPSLADRLSAANWAMLGRPDKARVCVRRVREANPGFDVDKWLSALPSKEQWHRDLYREGLKKAGF